MAVFKCKMCGGTLPVEEGTSICTCEYCGTKQTVPTVRDETLQNLFNRANVLRMKGEFDKAEEIYEKILLADEREAEAYWGLILCKYGIEYVEDPATLRRIPTCHRTSCEAVTADADYRNALKYADPVRRGIYQEEAKVIDGIQKGILAISQKEDPYDVFICYKEMDENGKRTQDSVLANDIYYQLKQEGFHVFYAAVTLEDKLGSEYEPYIFSALNTAKVMLCLGTRPEYFNAVWVKNEWSRFLKLMELDRSKLLIPCYRDMDAYDLPEEFAHLQAQDMSRIGFITDIVRGVRKVISREDLPRENTPVVREIVRESPVFDTGRVNIPPLLRRAFMFLEDREWKRADECCETVLNNDPENAKAYVGKLMAELNIRKQEELADYDTPFDDRDNYIKAVRFASPELKEELEGDIRAINARNEARQNNEIYDKAQAAYSNASTESQYREAANLFWSIMEWKDAKNLARDATKKAEEKRLENEREKKKREEQLLLEKAAAAKKKRRNRIIFAAAVAVAAAIAFAVYFRSGVYRDSQVRAEKTITDIKEEQYQEEKTLSEDSRGKTTSGLSDSGNRRSYSTEKKEFKLSDAQDQTAVPEGSGGQEKQP